MSERAPAIVESMDISLSPGEAHLREGGSSKTSSETGFVVHFIHFFHLFNRSHMKSKSSSVIHFNVKVKTERPNLQPRYWSSNASPPTCTAMEGSIVGAHPPATTSNSISNEVGNSKNPFGAFMTSRSSDSPVSSPVASRSSPTFKRVNSAHIILVNAPAVSGISIARKACPPVLVQNHAFSQYAQWSGDGASSTEALRINIYIPFSEVRGPCFASL